MHGEGPVTDECSAFPRRSLVYGTYYRVRSFALNYQVQLYTVKLFDIRITFTLLYFGLSHM